MPNLSGLHVLVAEDEWMIAEDMVTALQAAGAAVLSPAATVEKATAITARDWPDAALLDLKLADGLIFPFADALLKRRVPTIFVTGYDAGSIPIRYAHAPVVEKPVSRKLLLERLGTMFRPKLRLS